MAAKEEYQNPKGGPRKGGSYVKGKDGKEKLVSRTLSPPAQKKEDKAAGTTEKSAAKEG